MTDQSEYLTALKGVVEHRFAGDPARRAIALLGIEKNGHKLEASKEWKDAEARSDANRFVVMQYVGGHGSQGVFAGAVFIAREITDDGHHKVTSKYEDAMDWPEHHESAALRAARSLGGADAGWEVHRKGDLVMANSWHTLQPSARELTDADLGIGLL